MDILVIDDSKTARLLLKAFFPKDKPYTIHEASDMKTALEVAEKSKPAVIFIDYNLPGTNGVKIAEALLLQGNQSKYVLMTANLQDFIIEDSKRVGFSGLLSKPISTEAIKKVLAEIG
jgi:CheY-like chemotaxis protein